MWEVCRGIHVYTMKEFYTIWEMNSHKTKKEYSKKMEKNNKHLISLSEQTMEHVFPKLQKVKLLWTESSKSILQKYLQSKIVRWNPISL